MDINDKLHLRQPSYTTFIPLLHSTEYARNHIHIQYHTTYLTSQLFW